MSVLATIALLLQSALVLLQLAQSMPNLPQSVRDQAEQNARTAITAATQALNPQQNTQTNPQSAQSTLPGQTLCLQLPGTGTCAPTVNPATDPFAGQNLSTQ